MRKTLKKKTKLKNKTKKLERDVLFEQAAEIAFFFQMRSRLSIRSCFYPPVRRSVRLSVRHTQVDFRNGISRLNFELNKIESEKAYRRKVCEQISRTHLMSELCQICLVIQGNNLRLKVVVITRNVSSFFSIVRVNILSVKNGRTQHS